MNKTQQLWSGASKALMLGAMLTIGAGAVCAQGTPRAQGSRPFNDDFEDAQPFTTPNGGSYLTTGYWYGSTNAATDQDDEPTHAGNYGGKSVWFAWVAPSSGTVTFTTAGSKFDTLLAAYRGSNLEDLGRIASNDNVSSRDETSLIRFNAIAGATYFLAVDGYNGDDEDDYDADPEDADSGYYRLNIFFSNGGGSVLRPANDNFASPFSLGSTTQRTIRGTNVNATREAGEPSLARQSGGRSVWFTWTAPLTGYAQISTGGSNFPTAVAAYYGSNFSNLRVYGSGIGNARFYAVRGYTYRIALDSTNGSSGNYVLSLTQNSYSGT